MAFERRKHERHTSNTLLEVIDRSKGNLLGWLANISQQGAMLITEQPVKSRTKFKCRVKIARKILARDELIFDAECRWCRKNVEKDRWESGYQLTMSEFDSELISFLELSFKLGDLGDKGVVEPNWKEAVNRRHLERYDLKQPLPVYEQKSYREIGRLVDLSTHGAKIVSKRNIAEGDIVDCRVRLDHAIFRQDYLYFTAQCRWSRKRDDGCFDSGYQINRISERDSAVLLHLLIHCCEPSDMQVRVEVSQQ